VQRLLEWGSPLTPDKSGRTPIELARGGGHYAIVQLIEDYQDRKAAEVASQNRTPDNGTSGDELRALVESITAGNEEQCAELVTQGCPLNRLLPPNYQLFPLTLAVLRWQFRLAKLFLDNGASTLVNIPNGPHLIQHLCAVGATELGANDLLPELLSKYVEEAGYITQVRGFLSTILHTAVSNGNLEAIEHLFTHILKNYTVYM